jgi:hypothetical protein
LLIEYLLPVADAAVSWRKVIAIAIDIDIPACDLRGRGGAPDAVGALRLRACRARQRKESSRVCIGHLAVRGDAPRPDLVVVVKIILAANREKFC